ncbi:hypothetical protein [Caballeronia sordidicola]|nr:hypothetical protein [Caballeronia sordidicola]
MAKPIIGGKTRPSKLERRNLLIAMCGLIAAFVAPSPVFADDWGCQVLLCLADPRGPETESECKPPIEKLWDALNHGRPFPTCDLNSSAADLPPDVRSSLPASPLNAGQGTSAQNVGAGPNYCSPDLFYWGPPEQSMLTCGAHGAINVTIDNTLITRVWWGINGKATITEFYGQGSTALPYDPASAAQRFLSKTDSPGSGNVTAVNRGGNH